MAKQPIKYELILIFDWYKKLPVKEIFKKLPKGYCSLKTLYNYHNRWVKANKKAMELMK
jgi:hypothetical protein